MKRWVCMILCILSLIVCPVSVSAEGTSDAASASAEEVQDDSEPSKGVKIAGFLVIFTISMGVTGYIVVRPKLKLLKDAREKNK